MEIRHLKYSAAWLAGISFLVLSGLMLRPHLSVAQLEQIVTDLGIWAPVGFILLYAIGAIVFLPGVVFTLAGGFIFGPWLGMVCNLTGALLGGTLSFVMARTFAHDWVIRQFGCRLQTTLNTIQGEGWRFVAMVRLMPLLPFSLLNYALGITSIGLSSFVVASAIFMLPSTAVYTYVGSLGKEALASNNWLMFKEGIVAMAMLIVLSVFPKLLQRLRRR